MSEVYSIDDPRHPLQMDCSAAERHVSKWRAVLASCESEGRKKWARGNLSFHERCVEGFKRRIAAEKGAA